MPAVTNRSLRYLTGRRNVSGDLYMLIRKAADILSSEITPKRLYMNRRSFLIAAGTVAGATVTGVKFAGMLSPSETVSANAKLNYKPGPYGTTEKQTPFNDIENYNNYYEFSTDKYEPAKLAQQLQTRPWTIEVGGLVKKKQTFDIESLLTKFAQEERIYRHRCVEGWSMVIPWVGFSLADFIKQVQPLGKAKYVKFYTKYDPGQMPGQRYGVLDWPYVEGLRMDEA